MKLWQKKIQASRMYQALLASGKDWAKTAEALSVPEKELKYLCMVERFLWDFEDFSEQTLKILPKIGGLQTFRLNTPQRKLLAARDRQRMAGKPVRIRMLKARQWGGSTETQGWLFEDTILRKGRRSLTIAHDIESANHLRDMSERYYDNYPLPKPIVKKMTDKTWKFKHQGLESTMRIDTAQNLSAGHSLTINNLHASELQQWDHGETILRGLMPTIPNDPDTMVIEEGTGSGVGDFWYDRIQEAMGEQKTWEFVFVPWFELDDAQVNFENGDKFSFEKSLNVDEKLLFEGGVTLERLNWRRWKLGSEFRSDPEGFKQQYPSNPDEAFLSSGRPVFRPEKVRERMLRSKPPIRQGYLERRSGKVILVDDTSGYWKLWEEPVIGKKNLYALGEDGSQGKAIIPQLGGKGCDYSAARIFRRDTRKFVATFHARLDPDVVSQEVEMASEYFGGRENVGTLIEENPQGGGNLTIRALKHSPHVRLLRTPVLNKRADFNKDDEYGWFTKTNTKRLLVDEMKEAIREGTYEDFDKETWYECSTYVHDEKGGADAQKGKFDDLVMATGITLQADKLMPMVFASVAEKKESYSRDIDMPIVNQRVSKESVMESTYANY